MRSLLFALLVALVCPGGQVAAAELQGRESPYLFCNVYLSGACFGLAQGDTLTMEVVLDFVIYDLKIGDNKSIRVYSGFNPSLLKDQKQSFSKCLLIDTQSPCKSREIDDAGFEALIGPAKNGSFVHVIVKDGMRDERVRKFLRNVRSCKNAGDVSIACQN